MTMSALAVSGPVPTLWDGNGPQAAFAGARELLAECRPGFVQIHSGEPGLIVKDVRKLLPDVGIVMGLGVDGTARDVTSGRRTVSLAVEHLVLFARKAVDIGALAICWNAEGDWKTAPNTAQRKQLSLLVRSALSEVASAFPQLAQWHTSYDHPTYHSTYNWSDWIGKQSPVAVSLPQVYAAGDGNVMASRGALPWREAQALSSWKEAVKAGWIDNDVPDGQPGDDTDVDWRPYLQLHHVVCSDTCSVAVKYPFAAGWALSSRADEHGRSALRALCELHRRGFWSPDGIVAFQRCAGLEPDGRVGANTLAALGVRSEL